MGDTANNDTTSVSTTAAVADVVAVATTDGNNLPPPKLSKDEIDRLFEAMASAVSYQHTPQQKPSPSSSSSQLVKAAPKPTLHGTEVLVPAFGGVAFYRGTLHPETTTRSGHTSSSIGDENDNSQVEEEEIVYVSVDEPNKQHRKQKKKKQPLQQQQTEGDLVPVTLSDAIEWLRKHSSFATTTSKKANDEKSPKPKTTDAVVSKPKIPSTAPQKVTNATTTATSSSTQRPKQTPAPPASSLRPSGRYNSSSSNDSYDSTAATPMFNITEEYSVDGTRIVGEAVNLSSRLKAAYGDDDNPENLTTNDKATTRYASELVDESKTEEMDAPFDPTTAAPESPVQKVPDEEYDRISKRLEELALMEKEESRRLREGRRRPAKPLGGVRGPPSAGVAAVRKSKPSSSSFGFKKGFLNNNSSKGKDNNNNNNKIVERKTAATKRSSKNAASGSARKDGQPPGGGRITIDVSQNKVHEIPREGKQQPVPQRITNQPRTAPTGNANNRLLNTSIFSGQITERQQQQQQLSQAARMVGVANSGTTSLQQELGMQQQRQTKPKRVSRFKQQRQQEQQR